MPIKQSVAYAIGAMMELSQSARSDPLPCRVICKRIEMPEAYVLQILRKLRVAGLVNSTRGVQGGYSLIRPLEQISVLEVYEALGYCMEKDFPSAESAPNHLRSRESLEQILQSIASELRSCMGDLKIADLF